VVVSLDHVVTLRIVGRHLRPSRTASSRAAPPATDGRCRMPRQAVGSRHGRTSVRYDRPMPTRAIVLAGGGLTGIGWELGVLLGMQSGGVDVTAWDRIVGTSAGSVVGASLGGPDGLGRLATNLQAVEPGALSAHEE